MDTHAPPVAESWFDADELFFSVTDPTSRILAGNAVFQRVSRYPVDQLIGAPHNLIRHPDMPRCVFRILWDRIRAGLPVAAYVQNRARDGAHYWVVATVVPVAEGYLSVRQKPCGPHFPIVQGAYAELVRLERSLEADGVARDEVIAASLARLDEMLVELGLAGYEAFMRAMLPAELAARPEARRLEGPADDDALTGIARATARLGATFTHVFENLGTYEALAADLDARARTVTELADDVRLSALNAVVASARLGDVGPPLGVIAERMRCEADETTAIATALRDEVEAALSRLPDIAFDTAIAKLQADMAGFFVQEAATAAALPEPDAAEEARAEVERAVVLLADALAVRATALETALRALEVALATIQAHAGRLDRALDALGALQMGGRVEIARIADGHAFTTLFESVQATIARATDAGRGLRSITERSAEVATAGAIRATATHLDAIRGAAPRIRARCAPVEAPLHVEPETEIDEPIVALEEPPAVEPVAVEPVAAARRTWLHRLRLRRRALAA